MTQASSRSRSRGSVALIFVSFVSTLVLLAAAFAGMAAFLYSAAAGAAERPTPVRLSEIRAGGLLFRTTEPGRYLPAPMLTTNVEMDVSGMVARVTVSQRFYNPTEDWLEGIYVFPLPEKAAVDRLRLQIGDRFIEGRIKEREAARKAYEEARAEGRKASLIEEERPNIFTNSVANIGPGEDVVVQIEYQETVAFDAGRFSLRYPMVVAPRFIPGAGTVKLVRGGGGDANRGDDGAIDDGGAGGGPVVPDADRITPPVRHPDDGKINPVEIDVTLAPGFAIAGLASPSHEIAIKTDDDGRRRIRFKAGAEPADADFVLAWRAAPGTAPNAALFTEVVDGQRHLLLMVVPPATSEENSPTRLPREIIFIIDTSGSMHGASLMQARAALLRALDRLGPEDRFNVIRFSDTASALFVEARPADAESLAIARHHLRRLQAEGGTNMMSALDLALDGRKQSGRLRQVIFLTDGAVGNEAALFKRITARLGDSRMFTVGIGSAPNSYFMRKAALFGRGSFTYIGDVTQVKSRMEKLFRKIEAPVVTDIRVAFPGADPGVDSPETWPHPIPDLYLGEPVLVTARLAKGATGDAVVTGRVGGKDWRRDLPLTTAIDGKGVGALWARNKIGALMDKNFEGADPATTKAKVVQVALAHHLVSAHTSLVAVDVTKSRPDGKDVHRAPVETNLPKGWTYEKIFGAVQQNPKKTKLRRQAWNSGVAGTMKLAAAKAPSAADAASPAGAKLIGLPQGASPATLRLLLGLGALLLAAILWGVLRRRRLA